MLASVAGDGGVAILAWRGNAVRAVFSLNVSEQQARAATAAVVGLIEQIGLGVAATASEASLACPAEAGSWPSNEEVGHA